MKINEKVSIDVASKLYKDAHGKISNDETTGFITLTDINKVYANNVQAVFDFNLEVEKNDFVALVGPSGCGKSTTLRMIAGLEDITSGTLYIDKVLANYLPCKDRDIAMVFQSYALYPQLSVYDNIGFGLKIRKDYLPVYDRSGNPILDEYGNEIKKFRHYNKKEIEERIFKAADILDLGKYLDRKPKELSGGQMQRVALGRAIVRDARIFLMDEPLSNLDAKLRVQMRSEIVRIHEEVGATTIYVTHDQTEAMTMANKIVVMNKGFIQQIGSPLEIYKVPRNRFVATFIGTPPMNIVKCSYFDGVLTLGGGLKVSLKPHQIEKIKKFYEDRIQLIEKYIQEIKETNNFLLARKLLLSINGHRQKEDPEIDPKKAKKAKKIPVDTLIQEILEELETMKQTYTNYLKVGGHDLELGIRPEHISLVESKKGNSSLPFKIVSDIVEILGSEFIVYATSALGKLTIKTNDEVVSHQVYDVVFDEDKIQIFDEISTENIFF